MAGEIQQQEIVPLSLIVEAVTLSTTHAYDRPGVYFVTGRVHSHRQGDVKATSCCIPNLAQARVVVATVADDEGELASHKVQRLPTADEYIDARRGAGHLSYRSTAWRTEGSTN